MISVKTTSMHIQSIYITVPSPTCTLYVHIFGFIIRHISILHGMYSITVKRQLISAEESNDASQVLFLLPQLFVFLLNCCIIYYTFLSYYC